MFITYNIFNLQFTYYLILIKMCIKFTNPHQLTFLLDQFTYYLYAICSGTIIKLGRFILLK